MENMYIISVAPSAPAPSRSTLKDYMNAGGIPRPSGTIPQPYPGYINPATTSHQAYQQPQMNAGGVPRHPGHPGTGVPQSYPGYINPATTSHQTYQQPPVQHPANFNTRFQPPTSQSYQVCI